MTLRPCGNPNCLTQTGQHVAGSSEERSCQHDGQSDARRAAGTATAAARAANPPERDTETLRRFAEDATVNGDAAAFFGATESQIALVLGENPDLWYPEGDEDDGDYRWTPREGFMEALAEKVGDDAADMGASFEKVGVASFETDPAKWTSDSQQADWCNQWIEVNGDGRSEPIEDITGTYPCNDGDWIGDVRVPGNAGTADFRLTRNPVTGEIVAEPIAEVLAP